jgi:hypothetical protein
MESAQVNEQKRVWIDAEDPAKALGIVFVVYFFSFIFESIQLGHWAFRDAIPPKIGWGLLAYLGFLVVLELRLEHFKSKNIFSDAFNIVLCFGPFVWIGLSLIHSLQFLCWILATHLLAYIQDLGGLRTGLNRSRLRALFEIKEIKKPVGRVPSWYSYKAMRPFILFILLFWVFPTFLTGVIDLGSVSFFDPSELESLQYTQQMTRSLFNLTVAFDGKLDEGYPFGLNFYVSRKFSEKDYQQKMIEKYGETDEAIKAAQASPSTPPTKEQVSLEENTVKPFRTFLLTTVDDLTALIQARTASEIRCAGLLALCALFYILFLADLPRAIFVFFGGGKILSAEDAELLSAYEAQN